MDTSIKSEIQVLQEVLRDLANQDENDPEIYRRAIDSWAEDHGVRLESSVKVWQVVGSPRVRVRIRVRLLPEFTDATLCLSVQ